MPSQESDPAIFEFEVHDWDKIDEVIVSARRLKAAHVAQRIADRETALADSAFHASLHGISLEDRRLLGRMIPTVVELLSTVNNGDRPGFFK